MAVSTSLLLTASYGKVCFPSFKTRLCGLKDRLILPDQVYLCSQLRVTFVVLQSCWFDLCVEGVVPTSGHVALGARERCQVTSSITLYLIPVRQGLSLNQKLAILARLMTSKLLGTTCFCPNYWGCRLTKSYLALNIGVGI